MLYEMLGAFWEEYHLMQGYSNVGLPRRSTRINYFKMQQTRECQDSNYHQL